MWDSSSNSISEHIYSHLACNVLPHWNAIEISYAQSDARWQGRGAQPSLGDVMSCCKQSRKHIMPSFCC